MIHNLDKIIAKLKDAAEMLDGALHKSELAGINTCDADEAFSHMVRAHTLLTRESLAQRAKNAP